MRGVGSGFSLVKNVLLLAACLGAAGAAVRAETAAMTGESVYVHLSDRADATVVGAFEEWAGGEAEALYFPIFGRAGDAPLRVLDESGLEVDLNGKRVETLAPCAPPDGFKNVAAGRRVFWFKADVAETLADEKPATVLQVRVRYTQALIAGRFYYLPVLPRQPGELMGERPWAWQLHARSDVKVPKVLGTTVEREQLRDTVIVYLRHAEVVEIAR